MVSLLGLVASRASLTTPWPRVLSVFVALGALGGMTAPLRFTVCMEATNSLSRVPRAFSNVARKTKIFITFHGYEHTSESSGESSETTCTSSFSCQLILSFCLSRENTRLCFARIVSLYTSWM